MTDFSAWYDDVLPDVMGCEPPLALKHIRQTVIDFCNKSLVLVKDVPPFNALPNVASYPLAVSGYDIAMINSVLLDKDVLTPKSRDALQARHGPLDTKRGKPTGYFQTTSDTLTLGPTPDAAGLLRVRVSVKPTRLSDGVDDWLFTTHYDAIAHGAKARLFEMPGKPWTSNELAMYHARKYELLLNEARRSGIFGMTRTPKRVKAW